MEPSRKRDRREYQMGRYDAKKQKCMERKEERVKTMHDKDKRRSFTEKGDAWKRLKEKMMER